MAVKTFSGKPWTRFYDSGVPSSLSYPDTTLGAVLAQTARKFPDHIALRFYGNKISFAELDRQANRFAHALTNLGIGKGDRVALMLPNTPHMVIAYYGTLRTGAVAVPTNPLYHERELEVQLRDCGAETLVALDMFYRVICRALPNTSVKHLILGGVKDFLPFTKKILYPVKARIEKQWVSVKRAGPIHDFLGVLHHQPVRAIDASLSPDDIAILQYTGGTTGIPKGAVLTHRNMIVNAVQSRAWLNLANEGTSVILAAAPFFHVYGMTTCMNLGILIGAEQILLPKFHTKEVVECIEKYRAQIFPGIQAMYLAIAQYPHIEKHNLSSLTMAISGAGPLMREVQECFEGVTGGRIVEGYGLSEAAPVTHANPIFGARKIGSIGLPWPDVEARIVDIETGRKTLAPGEAGELVVRGPQVMQGYWNKPEETALALRGGWLHTGDIATMDEEGYFYIVDRIKDMIKTVGESVYPREVEEVLFTHPKVQEAVVVGIPEKVLGEKVKAYIVLKEGKAATADEIISYCRARLPKFKVPKEIEFRQELPKTLVGKVLRRVLRDEELNKNAINGKRVADLIEKEPVIDKPVRVSIK